MNDLSKESLLNDLPAGLRQAVVAAIEQAPNHDVERRVIASAIDIANRPEEPLLAEVADSPSATFEMRRVPSFPRTVLAAAGIAAMFFCFLIYTNFGIKVDLAGQLASRQTESGETEWFIRVDVDAPKLAEINALSDGTEDDFAVRCYLRCNPANRCDGRLSRQELDAASELVQNGNATVVVELNQDDLIAPNPCPAAVSVIVGRSSIGETWFRSLFDFIESRWIF